MKKSMMVRIISLALVVLLCFGGLGKLKVFAQNDGYTFKTNIPKLEEKMLDRSFWIKNDKASDKIIMDSKDIEQYNKQSEECLSMIYDLENYKENYTKKELTDLIKGISKVDINDKFDSRGNKISESEYSEWKSNLNLSSIGKNNKVKYGITVKRTLMKTMPTYDMIFKEGDNHEFDRLMETAVYPVEPLVILSTSADGKWYFAQMYNYCAWIPVEDVAIAENKKALFNYLDSKDSLVVTGKDAETTYNPLREEVSQVKLDMGVKIPLANISEIPDEIDQQSTDGNYVVKLPVRDKNGNMKIELAIIARCEDVRVGYLPYTQKNILNQAFKFIGERYGWGGMFDGRDCTSFLMDIYRTVGIKLPRNSGEQEKYAIGKVYEMPEDMTLKEREKLFDKLTPGTCLYMSGHAMLYIGEYKGEHYMIHDFSGFYAPNESGKQEYYNSRQVMVTPMTIGASSDGTTYLESLYNAKQIVVNK